MMNRILLVLLLINAYSFVGCTSKKVEGDSPEKVETQADVDSTDSLDGDSADLDSSDEGWDDESTDSVDANSSEDKSDLSENGGDNGDQQKATDEAALNDDDNLFDDVGDQQQAAKDNAATADQNTAGNTDDTATAPAIDEGASSESTDVANEGSQENPFGAGQENTQQENKADGVAAPDAAPVHNWVPVKKIASAPFHKAGVLANTVYIARKGDTLKKVSKKIYGTTAKVGEIKKVNPYLHNSLKVGDKVYYNSPTRPTDDQSLLTFYEDIGLQPEVYVSQPGDNIRQVSKSLLGNKDSWKEVWATNRDVDSKGKLSSGTPLKYWSGSNVSATQMAQADVGMPEPPSPPNASGSVNDLPPPPTPPTQHNDLAQQQHQAEIPPPPPPPAPSQVPPPPSAAGTMDNNPSMGGNNSEVPPPPPPPPSMRAQNDVPPPPPPRQKRTFNHNAKKFKAEDSTSSQDQTMALGAAAILLLAGVGLIIVIRKKKAKKTLSDFVDDSQTQTHTQIDG